MNLISSPFFHVISVNIQELRIPSPSNQKSYLKKGLVKDNKEKSIKVDIEKSSNITDTVDSHNLEQISD